MINKEAEENLGNYVQNEQMTKRIRICGKKEKKNAKEKGNRKKNNKV
jgi:hypothetical protein